MYEILIKKTEYVEKHVGKDWEVIREEPLQVEDTNNYPESYKGKMKKVYGYTPVEIKKVLVEREILKQTVEDLNLNAVIIAINDLKMCEPPGKEGSVGQMKAESP